MSELRSVSHERLLLEGRRARREISRRRIRLRRFTVLIAKLGLPLLGMIPMNTELYKPTVNQACLRIKGEFVGEGTAGFGVGEDGEALSTEGEGEELGADVGCYAA